MNDLSYINNMGIETMSNIEKRTLKVFIENNRHLCTGMKDIEIYEAYKNSFLFVSTRLNVAFGNFKKELISSLK